MPSQRWTLVAFAAVVVTANAIRTKLKCAACPRRDLNALFGWYKTQPPVSFYLYDTPEYDACLVEHAVSLEEHRNFKHGGEVWWLNQLQRSPWRVADPAVAKFHIIPLHPGWNARYGSCEAEFKGVLARILTDSPPSFLVRRHVLLSTDYKAGEKTNGREHIKEWCPTCILIRLHTDMAAPMVGHLHRRTSPKDHVNLPPAECSLTRNQTHQLRLQTKEDFALRPNSFYFVGQADGRPAYRSRAQARRVFKKFKNSKAGFSFVNLHPGRNESQLREAFCQQTASSRFSLHIRGDNPQSSRIYEGIDVGSVLVMMSDSIRDGWLPGRHIPWENFTITVKEHQSDAKLAAELRQIASLPAEVVESKRREMLPFAPSLLWDAPNSVVAEVLLLDLNDKFNLPR